MTKDGLKLWQATKKSTNTIVKYWQGQGVKASNNEVKLSLYHGNNKVTLNSESQRTWHASTSFVSPQIVMGSMILQPTLNNRCCSITLPYSGLVNRARLMSTSGMELLKISFMKKFADYSATKKTVNTWNILGMFIVLWPITAKIKTCELATKPQTN